MDRITRAARQEEWKLRVGGEQRLWGVLLLLRRQFLERAQDLVRECSERDRVRLPDAYLVEHDRIPCVHAHDMREVRQEGLIGRRVVSVDEDVERLRRVLRAAATGGDEHRAGDQHHYD